MKDEGRKCEGCGLRFYGQEKALWCRKATCPTTVQRSPTDQQRRHFRMDEEPSGKEREERYRRRRT